MKLHVTAPRVPVLGTRVCPTSLLAASRVCAGRAVPGPCEGAWVPFVWLLRFCGTLGKLECHSVQEACLLSYLQGREVHTSPSGVGGISLSRAFLTIHYSCAPGCCRPMAQGTYGGRGLVGRGGVGAGRLDRLNPSDCGLSCMQMSCAVPGSAFPFCAGK